MFRFHDIAWSQSSEDYPRGIIAGALESGSLDLWDAEKLQIGPRLGNKHQSIVGSAETWQRFVSGSLD